MNQIQTQLWELYYSSSQSLFLGCSYGNGRSLLQLLAIMHFFKTTKGKKCVYLSPWPG